MAAHKPEMAVKEVVLAHAAFASPDTNKPPPSTIREPSTSTRIPLANFENPYMIGNRLVTRPTCRQDTPVGIGG